MIFVDSEAGAVIGFVLGSTLFFLHFYLVTHTSKNTKEPFHG